MTIEVKVIYDSISIAGKRLTTLELTYPRYIHSQLLTHRMLSRVSASSRAIPVHKTISKVLANPVIPTKFGKNQAGMQAQVEEVDREEAVVLWLEGMYAAIKIAKKFDTLGLHKQIANRVLEPYLHITTLVSATEWDNFFNLRLADDAQPEIQELAKEMKAAIDNSKPVERNFHLPYTQEHEIDVYELNTLFKLSSARCCRISYLNHNNEYDVKEDIALADKLIANKHLSPLEMSATAYAVKDTRTSNFIGWKQYRTYIENNR